MNVPFFRPSLSDRERERVLAVMDSGWLTTGAVTKEFEADFAAYSGRGHAVAVNSCTAALHLALEAIGLQRGEGVLVPTMTFAATAEVVRYFDAEPLLVDCDPDTLNLSLEDLAARYEAARERGMTVRAVIPVHYGGLMIDMERVAAFARERGLAVIEDAAHCCPAAFRGEVSGEWHGPGAFSDVACFSFYANKCITTGEGGMAATDDEALADRMRIMSLHGLSRDAWKRYTESGSAEYDIVSAGFKYNLTDVAAAIGVEQLKRADSFREERERVATRYRERLGGRDDLRLPATGGGERVHSWHLFAVQLGGGASRERRERFTAFLRERGVGTSLHWRPLHLHSYYARTYGCEPGDFPAATEAYERLVSLPIFPSMTEEEIDRVCAVVEEGLG